MRLQHVFWRFGHDRAVYRGQCADAGAESVFGRNLLLRTICGGLTSVLSGASAGLLVYLYGISGGPDAGRSFLQLYLPVAAYALIFISGAFLLLKSAALREAERYK